MMIKSIYEEKRNELLDKAQELIDNNEFENAEKVTTEIEKLDADFEASAKAQANLNALHKESGSETAKEILGGSTMTDNVVKNQFEVYSSNEYRRAFMENVLTGKKIPEQFRNAAAESTTGDVGSVIPTTVMDMIVQKIEKYGTILPLVTQTSYKGGVTIPTSAINLSASWVSERGTADAQEFTTGSVTFAYYKLICKVAVSFEVDKVTLDVFERTVAENIAKAMVKALEQAIYTGTGATGHQPKGFLTETVEAGQNVDITSGKHITYADLCAAEAALPEGYEETAVWTMTKKTFFNEIIGMVDGNGQPVARVNTGLDGKPEYAILGRKVVLNGYMNSFTVSPSANTIVAAIFDFSRYGLNTNYAMTIRQYTDEATDDVVSKAIMLADGKAFDTYSLVTITAKKA